MDEKNDILGIFNNIDNLLEVYENPNWFKLANVPKMEELFKCALSLENIFKNLSRKGMLSLFEKKLGEWWIHRGAPYEYEGIFFESICDKILHNVIVNTDNALVAESAVDWYLRHCGLDRLINVTKELLAFGDSYRMLANFKVENTPMDNFVRGQFLISFLLKELKLGRRESLVSHIHNIGNTSIPILLCILSMSVMNQETNGVQKIVQDTVLAKLAENNFFCQLANVDESILLNVTNHPDILEALILNLIRVGKLFIYKVVNGDGHWVNEEVGISYEKYVQLFRCFITHDNPAKLRLIGLIQELILEPNSSFWECIARESDVLL